MGLESPSASGGNQRAFGYGLTIAAAGTAVCGPSPKRRSIRFATVGAANIFLGNQPAPLNNPLGAISSTTGPLELKSEFDGNLVRGPWFAQTSAGNQTMAVTETFAD